MATDFTILPLDDEDGHSIALDLEEYKLQTPFVYSYRGLTIVLRDLIDRSVLSTDEAEQFLEMIKQTVSLPDQWNEEVSIKEMISYPPSHWTSLVYKYEQVDNQNRKYWPAEICN